MTEALPQSITRPLYMLSLARTGPGMTAAEIDYVAASELPLERDRTGGGLRGLSTLSYDLLFPVVGPKASEYLRNAGFIAQIPGTNSFRITEHGSALLKGAISQGDDSRAVFKLDPDAPLDYIGLLSELDSLDDPLVIDPYFHPYDFAQLVDALPGVTLLTIDYYVSKVDAFDKPKLSATLKRGQFEEALGRLTGTETTPQVIYVPSSALHDRYFLGSNNQGYFAGGSFRSSKATVVMELEAEHAGDRYRHYREIAQAQDATPLEPRTVPASSGPSAE
ncbi:hypothetical protein ACWGOE_06390 [Leucobacter chromiiresistens]